MICKMIYAIIIIIISSSSGRAALTAQAKCSENSIQSDWTRPTRFSSARSAHVEITAVEIVSNQKTWTSDKPET